MRIAVVGPCCSGKSTVANQISGATGILSYDIDAYMYDNNWRFRAVEDFSKAISSIVVTDKWIIHGNSRHVQEIIWARATLIIWLDFSLDILIWRVLRRTLIRIITARSFSGGKRESLGRVLFSTESILLRCLSSYRLWRAEYERVYPEWINRGLMVYRMTRKVNISELVNEIGREV
jgi:adenylate kinase family enzyme